MVDASFTEISVILEAEVGKPDTAAVAVVPNGSLSELHQWRLQQTFVPAFATNQMLQTAQKVK